MKFVPIDEEKTPLCTFKTSEDKAKLKDSCELMKGAAILVPPGVVVVDFDDLNQDKEGNSYDEKLIDYIIKKYNPYWIKSRNNHYHFYFKIPEKVKKHIKQGAKILTLGGFAVDYKTGNNSLAIVKVNGKMRESRDNIPISDEVLEDIPELPSICYPMNLLPLKKEEKHIVGFIEGDGRNDRLFRHVVNAYNKYKNIDIRDPILFLNSFMFKEPLEEEIVESMIERAPIYSSEDISKVSFEKERKIIRLSEIKPVKPKWLWYPYIPLGALVLLVGDPGIGKSYLALYIAGIVSNGDEFPFDNNPDKELSPYNVLFQNGEDGVSYTIATRLEKLKANKDNIIMIDESEMIFRIDQTIDLERIIKENNIKLVVIDPIQRYLPLNKSMDKANEVRDALSPLIMLAEKYECSIILICHKNKSKKSSDLYRALGSIDFVGACRSMLLIEKDGNNITLKQVKNSLSKEGPPLRIIISEEGLSVEESKKIDKEDKDKKIDIAKEFLLDILSKGEMSYLEISVEAEIKGISSSTLRRAKEELEIKSIQHDKMWYWIKE